MEGRQEFSMGCEEAQRQLYDMHRWFFDNACPIVGIFRSARAEVFISCYYVHQLIKLLSTRQRTKYETATSK